MTDDFLSFISCYSAHYTQLQRVYGQALIKQAELAFWIKGFRAQRLTDQFVYKRGVEGSMD
jgi:hypothetical protein